MPINARLTAFEDQWVPALNAPLKQAILADSQDAQLAAAMTYSV